MAYKFRKMLVSRNKYSVKCPYAMEAEYITVHNTWNDAPARNEVKYMISNNRSVSFHVAVDDTEVIQAIPFNRNAFHAGDGSRGTGNRKSIGIEICHSKSGGKRFEKAEDNAARYIAQLLKERKWGIDRVKKHQDWSGKYCPHRTLDLGWKRFLDMIKKYLDDDRKPIVKPAKPNKGFLVRVKTDLNIRKGAGCEFAIVGTIKNKGTYTIVQTKKSKDGGSWGRLKSGAGWINISHKYVDRV